MIKMKKTKKSAVIAAAMALVVVITGAFAFLTDTDNAINRFQFLDEGGNQTVDIVLTEGEPWDAIKAGQAAFSDPISAWNDMGEDIKNKTPDELSSEEAILAKWQEVDRDFDGMPDAASNAIYGKEYAKKPEVTNVGSNDVRTFVKVLVPIKNVVTASADGTHEEAAVKELYTFDKAATLADKATGNWELVDLDSDTENKYIENDAHTYRAYVFAYTQSLRYNKTTDALFENVELINFVNGQIEAGDNLNIYVDAYAVQAEGLDTTDANDIWDIVTNDYTSTNNLDSFNYFASIVA